MNIIPNFITHYSRGKPFQSITSLPQTEWEQTLATLNNAYKILLNNLPESSISFTYGDSLLAFDEAYRNLSGERYQNPLCTKVFLKRDLETLFSNAAFPKHEPLHIEAQVWLSKEFS